MSSPEHIEIGPDQSPCTYILKKRALGTGSYSSVYEAKNKITGMHYAAKQYSKKLVYGLEDSLQSEFDVLKKVSRSHPNILTLTDYFETPESYYLVTDLAAGGELFDRIVNGTDGRILEREAREITESLLGVVEYLHKHKIVHRDLKAENLLFQTDNSKNAAILVADFGLARVITDRNRDPRNGYCDSKLHDMSGTLSYMAPEIFDREVGHSFEVDMWAVGVITYFMLCGYMPFDCETDDETQQAIKTGDYMYEPPEYWNHISPQANDFIDKCFLVDPSKRLTAQAGLSHAWISGEIEDEKVVAAAKSATAPAVSSPSPQRTVSATNLRQAIENLQLPCMSHHPIESRGSSRSPTRVQQSSYAKGRMAGHEDSAAYSIHSLSTISSKLSLIEKSRFASLSEGSTLRGSFCATPDVLSTFNSPTSSQNVSREASYTHMETLGQEMKASSSASTNNFYKQNASFSFN